MKIMWYKISPRVIWILILINICSAVADKESLPTVLQQCWEYSMFLHMPQSIVQDTLNRPYLYVAVLSNGLWILDISNSNGPPSKINIVPKQELGGLDTMYVFQKGNYLYLALGNFFDAKGQKAGLAIVNVENPSQPKTVSLWISEKKLNGSAIILVEQDYAYLGAMNEGIFIFDISNKNEILLVSSIQPDIHFPKNNPNKIQHPNARGLDIYNNLLFVAYDAGGLRVIDITNKFQPKEIGKYINNQLGKKQQAYNNLVIHWPYAYIAVDYCGMEIVNISNLKMIQQIGWWNPWKGESWSNNWFNSLGHTNQLVLDRDQQLLFLSAGDSELQVIDISEPNVPKLVQKFGETKNNLGVWGVTVTSDRVYLSYVITLIPFKGTWAGIKTLKREK